LRGIFNRARTEEEFMERRDILLSTVALAAAGMGRAVRAEEDHAGHMHHHAGDPIHAALLAAVADCVRTGQVCIDHCLQLFAQGDNSTAACARSVSQVVPACQALEQLAALDSRYLPRYARVVLDMCKDCEEECRKHEKEHGACKACADACAACARECQKVAA
jgi:Cys-rich four helix bundle protein (predicted Tat secretion target)